MDDGILVKNQLCFLLLIGLTILLETNAANIYHEIHLSDKETRVLKSKGYPDGYPSSFQEEWTIHARGDKEIKIVFDDFQVVECSACSCDYLCIQNRDNYLKYYRCSERFCGSKLPPPIFSRSREIRLTFKKDAPFGTKGFRATVSTKPFLNFFISDEIKRNITEYFQKTKRQKSISINKWGAEITRSAVALFLYDPSFFGEANETGEAIGYELTLQTMSKLVMKKRISTDDLALIVNAMTVACIDPKKFYGLNLVAELRKRVDSSNDTNPFFLLSLCLSGDDMKQDDVYYLQSLFDAKLRPSWTGTQAMVIMALKCIARRRLSIAEPTRNMLLQLKRNYQEDGSTKNLKNTLLVIQAIIATGIDMKDSNALMALQSVASELNRTQVGVEEMYYILPIIKWKSLLHINSDHCNSEKIHTDLEEIKRKPENRDQRSQIQVSLIIGDNEDFFTKWKIKIAPGSSFYQALKNVRSSESNYNIQFMFLKGKPYIAGVNNFNNSVENGLFWFIYTRRLSSNDDLKLVEESLTDIQVDETTDYILWYRSESCRNIQGASSNNTERSDADVLHISSTVGHG